MREGCNNCGGPHPSSECDDKPIGGPEEEANYVHEGYLGGEFHENYYGRNSGNWHDRQTPDENQHSQSVKTYDPPPNPNDKTTVIHDDSDDEAKKKPRKITQPFSPLNKSNQHP
uniref:Uncharacterized protein n=1 Tax=Tanacetum cinerariifolium TaxID=118510 RepID=A0A699I5G8_TANCI|nr:hypothetical protein [Tanacetum cinerariifolium]